METMFKQNFGGKTKSIMVFLKVAYWLVCFSNPLWLYARQPGKVLNRLNSRQSKMFTEFPLKDFFKHLLAIDLCLELSID